MALQITEKNGTFYLEGTINTSTSQFLTTYVDHLLTETSNVTINIDQVSKIDKSGLSTLDYLMTKAYFSNRNVEILGYGANEIYDHFKQRNVA